MIRYCMIIYTVYISFIIILYHCKALSCVSFLFTTAVILSRTLRGQNQVSLSPQLTEDQG